MQNFSSGIYNRWSSESGVRNLPRRLTHKCRTLMWHLSTDGLILFYYSANSYALASISVNRRHCRRGNVSFGSIDWCENINKAELATVVRTWLAAEFQREMAGHVRYRRTWHVRGVKSFFSKGERERESQLAAVRKVVKW